jgi:hypothetical protein
MREALKDYFCSGEWKILMEDLGRFMGGGACHFVLEHSEKLLSFHNENPLCLRVDASPQGKALCLLDYERHLAECWATGREGLHLCHMGLNRYLIPLELPGRIRLALIMCGFRPKSAPPRTLLRHAETLGIGRLEFRRLYQGLALTSEKQLQNSGRVLKHFFSNILELLYLKEQLKALVVQRPS